MKRTFIIIIGFLCIWGCQNKDFDIAFFDDNNDSGTTKTVLTAGQNSPDNQSYWTEDEICTKIATLSFGKANINNIRLISGSDALSSYYFIDFTSPSGESGYCAYPAYRQIDEPLCYVENGSITDTTFIKPLKMFFDRIDSYLIETSKSLQKTSCPETKSLPEFNSDGTIVGSYSVIERDSLFRSTPVNWGQCPPLGAAIDYNLGYCSVVAVAQTMSYHKKSYKNIIQQSDWYGMNLGYNDQKVSALGADLFNELFTWNLIAPLAPKVVDVLNSVGYFAEKESGFSSVTMFDFMQDGPVILLGFQEPGILNLDTGHYWVADAIRTQTITIINIYEREWQGRTITYEGPGDVIKSSSLHYNWGWSGSSNGWFAGGVFQPNSNTDAFDDNMQMIHVRY